MVMALEMRETCERCGAKLFQDGEACICSYEHTYCVPCATVLQKSCPQCEGELLRRPTRRKVNHSPSLSPDLALKAE